MALKIEEERLREILKEVLEEFVDPDSGLELTPKIIEKLQKSKKEKEKGLLLSEDEVFK